jgi:hypothetical protein
MILGHDLFAAILGAGCAICNRNTAFTRDLVTCNIGEVILSYLWLTARLLFLSAPYLS